MAAQRNVELNRINFKVIAEDLERKTRLLVEGLTTEVREGHAELVKRLDRLEAGER